MTEDEIQKALNDIILGQNAIISQLTLIAETLLELQGDYNREQQRKFESDFSQDLRTRSP